MAIIVSMISMLKYSPKCEFLVENIFTLAYEQTDSKLVYEIVGPKSSWYADIFTYLRHKTNPIAFNPNKSKTFICQTACYTILGDTLFWKQFDGTLLRCLSLDEVQTTLEEVHQGIFGAHSSGLTLAKKLLRIGYYWPTMEADAYQFVKRFVPCQQHGDLIHAPAQDLQPTITPWPFSHWGFDLVGQVYPNSSNGHKYIIFATE